MKRHRFHPFALLQFRFCSRFHPFSSTKSFPAAGALLCLILALALFGVSLRQRPAAERYAALGEPYSQALRDKLAQAKSVGEQLRAGVTPAGDRYIYAFYFADSVLQRWTSRDIAVPDSSLAAVDTAEAFRQLGHSWYVTKAYVSDSDKVVTAVLIKREYAYENDFLQAHVSPLVGGAAIADVLPAGAAAPDVVLSASGAPLFRLVLAEEPYFDRPLALRWLALAVLVAGLLFWARCWGTALGRLVVVGLLGAVRYGIFAGQAFFYNSGLRLFAPSLYADSSFIPSLGSLLLDAVFLFLMAVVWAQWLREQASRKGGKKGLVRAAGLAAAGGCAAFIGYAWRSVILNSTIPLDLSHLDRLTVYTAAAYGALVLLFATVFVLLHASLNRPPVRGNGRLQGAVVCYIIVAAVYALVSLEFYGHRREELQARAWADKCELERDPKAEVYLNENVAPAIVGDTELALLIETGASAGQVEYYLGQHYLQGYMQYYDLQVTVCPYATQLHIEGETAAAVDCRTFFEGEIALSGARLSEDSPFYCLLNDNGRHSYLGVLRYAEGTAREVDVFLELDSQLLSGGEGYPELLIEKSRTGRIRMPLGYSFAKYAGDKLILHGGEFRYPYDNRFSEGARTVEDGYVHLIYHFDSYHTVVVSRVAHTFWHWAVLFLYLFLVTAGGLAALLPLAGLRPGLPALRNTFKRKISMLVVAAFMVSIISTAVGSIWYSVHRFREGAVVQMEDKIRAAMVQLDYNLGHLASLYEADRWELETKLVQVSNSLRIDINVYDLEGKLFASSRMEVFDRGLQSRRLHWDAFERLAGGATMEFVNRERIGNLAFNAMYGAYYNRAGAPVAYVNVPYFSKRMQDIRETSAVITAIINVYILALITALALGAALANRLLRPLEIVRKHMQRLDVTQKMDYIHYDERDELGDLIRAYNQMVGALEESAQRLAQSERESAWREMARQIAHEIKNPLTPMQLSIQHLVRLKKEQAKDWPAKFDALAVSLLEQIETLAKTASEFSDFARMTKAAPEEVRLDKLLDELRALFESHGGVEFEWRNTAGEARITAHPDLLSRVFLNLLTNAVQAVEGKQGGHIRITLEAIGEGYNVRIEDNGEGVKEPLQKHLFTPNFTTKTSGSGLGLAISKKIMEHEGGNIYYSRSDMGGACFNVTLGI
ncbi:MAG: HAMP domain-containing protein [Prevotellaceae bacterium]|nr:HAMP domain-containing protein [Prevotellaceae bacterium]